MIYLNQSFFAGLHQETETEIVQKEFTEIEKAIIEKISAGISDIDMLIQKCDFAIPEIQEALVMLELDGCIMRAGNSINIL